MGLPNGYTELEYIESSGTQYINTGVKATAENFRVKCRFTIANIVNYSVLFGGGASTDIISAMVSNAPSLRFYAGSSLVSSADVTIAQGVKYEVECYANNGTLTVVFDGKTYSGSYSSTINKDYPLFLFASNASGTAAQFVQARIDMCQIYDNDVLVRDYVPCLNSSNEAGLYDLVNNVFYGNAGSGSFVAGHKLPSDYTELYYIGSSGTQYVDTGFAPNQDTRCVMDVKVVQILGYAPLFGARVASKNDEFATWAITESTMQDDYDTSADANLSVVTTQRNIIDKNKNVLIANGVTLKTHSTSTFQSAYNMYLFNINTSGSTTGSFTTYARVYSCQIYDNGTLVRDFIPCISASNEVGLFDRISNSFYGNAGTGTFTAGYRIPQGYTELTYIESTGTQHIDTGFMPNQDTRCVMDVDVAVGGTTALFGARTAASTATFTFFQITGSYLRSDYGTQQTDIQIDPVQRLLIDKNKNTTTVNGSSVTATAESFQNSCNLVLLSVNTNGTVGSAKLAGKLYSCQVYDNGFMVRDFVPVLTDTSEVALYDVYNGQLYSNAGTGVFLAGEPVEPDVPVIEYPAPALLSDAPGVVTITWDAVEGAERYIIYADQSAYSIADTTTATIYGLRPNTDVLLAYAPVLEGEESNASNELLVTVPAWQGLNLITDRTAADVNAVKQIAEKIKTNTATAAELAQYVAGMKGAYKADDLNRVTAAVMFVADAILDAGYSYTPSYTKVDWVMSDYFYPTDLPQYLANVDGLRGSIPLRRVTPVTPANLKTYTNANDIEKIVEDVYAVYQIIMEAAEIRQAGTLFMEAGGLLNA